MMTPKNYRSYPWRTDKTDKTPASVTAKDGGIGPKLPRWSPAIRPHTRFHQPDPAAILQQHQSTLDSLGAVESRPALALNLAGGERVGQAVVETLGKRQGRLKVAIETRLVQPL